jgi:hypothetical protein
MYYILNETNQIIAADENLLELCGVSHIDELSLNIALSDTKFDLSETNITITTNHNDTIFPVSKTPLSSLLGSITLVEIQVEEEKAVAEEDDLSLLPLDDTAENIESLGIEESSEEKEVAIEDNELFDLVMEEETESISPLDIEDTNKETEVAIEDNELFDLIIEEERESIETVEEPLDTMTEDTDILDL